MSRDASARFTLCEDTGMLAVDGRCPAHDGDACLLQYMPCIPEPEDDQAWVDAAGADELTAGLAIDRIRVVLVSMSDCINAGTDGPDTFQVQVAIEALGFLERVCLPGSGADWSQAERIEPAPPAVRMVRVLPAVELRVESGLVQFGEDWPGLFIRGDLCAYLAFTLDHALHRMGPESGVGPFEFLTLEGLVRDLQATRLPRRKPE